MHAIPRITLYTKQTFRPLKWNKKMINMQYKISSADSHKEIIK